MFSIDDFKITYMNNNRTKMLEIFITILWIKKIIIALIPIVK
jgi:hypothetical protein